MLESGWAGTNYRAKKTVGQLNNVFNVVQKSKKNNEQKKTDLNRTS